MSAGVEQLEFQAEARQLLDLMVHSVYSDKDSFLRELISNASDALDKLRIEAFRNKDLDVDTSDLHIEIDADNDARTLTIRDNGIGMTRAEVVDLIGTLAKSGTAELRQQLQRRQERSRLRGADRSVRHRLLLHLHGGRQGRAAHAQGGRQRGHQVGVERRRHLHHRHGRGRSAGNIGHPAPQARRRRGRAARLHLGVEDRTLVKKYSDFIAWPIRMEVEKRPPGGGRRRRHRHQGDRDPQLGQGAVGPAQRRGVGGGVQGVLQAHRARLGRAARGHLDEGRGHFRIPSPAVHPVAGPARLVRAGRLHRCAVVRQTGLHHGRLRPAHAPIPALRQGRRRRTRPVAERFPRDPATGSADQRDPAPVDQEGPLDDQGSAVRAAGRLPHLLGRVRQGPQRGPDARLRQPGDAAGDLLVRLDAQRGPTHHARRVRRADERGPAADLLRHRRITAADPQHAAPRGVQSQGL